MLIGLTGKKRRGKDTVANYLVEKYGFNRHGFADKVKELAYAINPLIPVGVMFVYEFMLAESEAEFVIENGYVFRLQYLVDALGWERAKEITEVRSLLQKAGTEGGRTVFWREFWIDMLFQDLRKRYDVYFDGDREVLQSNIVISDVRFDNEAERIKQYGGLVIRVESTRDGLPEPDSHASEQDVSVNLIDGTLHNDGTIEELYKGVDDMLDFVGFVRKT